MTVHFIGAGPGAADLITLRGARLLATCPVCLYAGSVVPPGLLTHCPPGARLIDTAPLDLDAIEAEFVRAHEAGHDVARLHSGDLSLYSAVAEQLRRLRARGIPATLTPGVPAFAAAAALLGAELTLPAVAQTIVLTRLPGRASAMPQAEQLETYAATGATLAIHLAIPQLPAVVRRLTPILGPDCPAAIITRATWPDEQVVLGTLATIEAQHAAAPATRTALILVGRALTQHGPESALYSPDYQRQFRSPLPPSEEPGAGAASTPLKPPLPP